MISYIFSTKHLLSIVIAFIAGICFSSFIVASCFLFLTSCYIVHQEKNLFFLFALLCCFFFFGSTRYYQNRDIYFSDANLLNKNCNVTATIKSILPRLDTQEQICILLKVHAIEINTIQISLQKDIYLFLPYYTTLWIKPHQKIVLKNITLKHPNSKSYQEYLIRENIWAITHQKKLSYITLQKASFLMQHITALCDLPLNRTHRMLSEMTQTLYLSIFCGKKIKSTTTIEMKRFFQYWGISHHLARSGLHLVLLIALLSFLFSCIPCSTLYKQVAIIGILSIYYSMTYFSIAFVRAFCMYIFYFICKQLSLPSKPLHILLITALVILIVNPHHLFFLDFQLSFIATILILWFYTLTQNRETIAY